MRHYCCKKRGNIWTLKQIVHVKERSALSSPGEGPGNELLALEAKPFFSASFEQNPLDGRADSALSVNMRSLEILYHRGYVEAIREFFRPPESQLESLAALLVKFSCYCYGARSPLHRTLPAKHSKDYARKRPWA